MKQAYAAEFAATIERAEKQIILARHGRRILALLDDTPMTPGNVRPAYEEAGQARQILNDAEDDLRDWQLDLEDIPFHHNQNGHQLVDPQHQAEGSATSQYGQDSGIDEHAPRVSSGSSVTTGPAYAPSTSRETETPAFV